MSGRILLIFCVFIGVQSISPPKLTLCKEKDSTCLTKTANTLYQLTIPGVPELNIESLDPMYHDLIQADLTDLKYKFVNSTIEGGKNCDVVNMNLDLQESSLILDFSCPLLAMHGVYEVAGKILAIPITGNGDYTIKCKDYSIQIDAKIKISQRTDGKKYLSIKNYQINGELKGGMVIDLTNLFNGKQKELAENVLHLLNENWKPIVMDLQGTVFNAILKKLVKNFNKYLKSVPLDQILLDV